MEKNRLRWIWTLVLVLLFCGAGREVYGQDKKRTYANFQGSLQAGVKVLFVGLIKGNVTTPEKAVNFNPKESSNLNIGVGLAGLASATQFLEFTTTGNHNSVRSISPNTPVTVKFGLPQSVLGLLDNISVGYFRDLKPVSASWPLGGLLGAGHDAGYDASYKQNLYSGSNLLNLANGAGELELTFSPPENYHGIYVKIEGNALSVALSNSLFHAFILENASMPCTDRDIVVDVLSGVRGGGVGVANATGSVTNPWGIVDGTSEVTLNVGAQLLSEVFHTTIFNTVSRPNQIAKVVLQNPGGGLLDLGLLTGLVIQPYLRNIPVGPALNNSSILSLRLLPGPDNKNELTVPITGEFDRIEIKMGGVIEALATQRIYDVSRTIGVFVFSQNELLDKLTACESVDLTKAIVNYDEATYDYEFYNDPVVESAATTVTNLADYTTKFIKY